MARSITPTRQNRLTPIGYTLAVLICIGWAGCGGGRQSATSISELRAHLRPLTAIGAYAGFDSKTNVLYMGNALIERWMLLGRGPSPLGTIRYTYKPSSRNYLHPPGEEFRFRIGELVFSGNSDLLTYDSYQVLQKLGGAKRVKVQFTYTPVEEKTPVFHLWVCYDIHPDLPVIRKWLTIQNLTDAVFFIEDITIESLPLFATQRAGLEIWTCETLEATGNVHAPPWRGDATEPFVIVYSPETDGGVALGNESPGVLKHCQVYSDGATVAMGLAPITASDSAEIRVPDKQSISTPTVWTMLFQGQPDAVMKDVLAYAAPSLEDGAGRQPKITWADLRVDGQTVGSSQPEGIIAVDYDWDTDDLERLKKRRERVHKNGNRFGIRIPLADIRTTVLNRPAWRLTPVPVLQRGLRGNRQERQGSEEQSSTIDEESQSEGTRLVYCVLSEYGYYVAQAVKTLLDETGANLLIFDGPVLGSQSSVLKGCAAFGHDHYSRRESIGGIYQWMFAFADHLHREYPKLQLGITSAAYGIEHPDIACLAHFDLFFNHQK